MASDVTRDEFDEELLDYYVSPNQLGWMLIMRRGEHLSLTQQFESVNAAIARAEVIALGTHLPLAHL